MRHKRQALIERLAASQVRILGIVADLARELHQQHQDNLDQARSIRELRADLKKKCPRPKPEFSKR